MRTAIVVAIGDELLSGETVDTNSSYLDGRLEAVGLRVVRHVAVPDDVASVAEAFRASAIDADVVLSTGGLGPTADDRTLEGLAAALGVDLVLHEGVLAEIEARFARRGRTMTPNNRRQAMLPAGVEVHENGVGSAPCVWARLRTAQVFVMPGVPSEVRWLMENAVLPQIERSADPAGRTLRRAVKIIGIGESGVETAIADVVRAHGDVVFGYRTMGAENQVKLAAVGPDAEARLDAAEAGVRAVLGDAVFGAGDDDLPTVVGRALAAAGQTVATAESCTGGLVAARLTDVAGSSAYVRGGVVAYANEVKTSALGVDPAVIAAHGAVSEAVARAMAAGVRTRLGADWGLSATGVAGPGGGTPDKPVGLVWIGLAGPRGVEARRIQRPGNRANVRDGTVKILLHWLLNALRAQHIEPDA